MAARTQGAVKAVTTSSAVNAVTRPPSGDQLSSGRHDADIHGMRAAAILLAALSTPAAAFASSSNGRVPVSVTVLPSVRFSQEVGAPVRKIPAAGGAFYVLPVKESVAVHGGAAPFLSVDGAEAFLRPSSSGASSVEGDLRVFVPEGSAGRVVVTVLADGAPPELRRKR